MGIKIVRIGEVTERYKSRSAIYDDVARGLFPPPIKLGPRAAGWPEHDLEKIIDARVAGKSDSEIKALVDAIVTARTAKPEFAAA